MVPDNSTLVFSISIEILKIIHFSFYIFTCNLYLDCINISNIISLIRNTQIYEKMYTSKILNDLVSIYNIATSYTFFYHFIKKAKHQGLSII